MTPTMGLIAGVLLLIALFAYTFWPENAFARQSEKTLKLDGNLFVVENTLSSAGISLTKTCAI